MAENRGGTGNIKGDMWMPFNSIIQALHRDPKEKVDLSRGLWWCHQLIQIIGKSDFSYWKCIVDD